MHISRLSLCLVSGLSLSAGVGAAPPAPLSERHRGEHGTQHQSKERADAVKEAFKFAWDGYYKYAFPHDELRPVTNSYANSRNGWGASAADALSTALVMEIPEIVNQIVDYVPTIDFSKSDDGVSLFETTIRYLAGMLSGYDLLKGPLSHLVEENKNVESLLAQSKALADVLKYAFDTPTGVPINTLHIENQTTDGTTINSLATIGTLVLEWTRLSDLLGDDEYAKLSQKGQSYLMNPKPALGEPFPGLVGSNVDVNTGLFQDGNGGWGGNADSFYEYLLKMYIYDPSRFEDYKERWIVAADSTMKYLTTHPEPRPDLTFVAEYASTNLSLNGGHLTCFHGGNFLLGGSVLNRRDYTNYGLSLVASCHALYTATLTRIAPESFSWDPTDVPEKQKDFFEKNGYYITNSEYILRPEVIESYYYAYQVTKEQKYRDWAWDAFVAINATTRAGSGFSSVTDVNAKDGGEKTDNQESFLFAEVMKYSYLIHAEDNVWQIDGNGQSEFVYNTEAHPFKVQGRLPGHGHGHGN